MFLPLAQAQFGRGGGTWNTAGADAQRSSWARTDNRINSTSMPGFAFLWKVKLANDAKQQYALSPAVMVDSYIGYRGFRSYAFVGGASNNVIALDTDLGRMEWTKNFGAVSGQSTAACPGAMTAGVTRTATLAFPAAGAAGGRGGRGGGRGAQSGVGEPEAGAVTIGQGRAGGGFGGFPGAPGGSGRGGRGPGAPGGRGAGPGRGARPPEAVYAVTTDGMLHTLYISNGEDAKPPVRFLPANANAAGIIMIDNVIYATTSGNCGGVPNGVWAIDTAEASPAPIHWSTNGGGVAGNFGAAFGPSESVYVATGDGDYSPAAYSDSVVSLETKTLKLKDWFTPGKSEFTASPVVFEMNEGEKAHELIAAANKDGRIYLLNSESLGGADHKTPLASASLGSAAHSLASWQDPSGTRWILAGTDGNITALKVTMQGGKPSIQTGWTSRAITSPIGPVVINGFVFAASTGSGSTLYGFDGVTGKEVFNSGSTIQGSLTHSGEISGSAGQLYLSTADSTLYAFGIPLVPPDLAAKTKN
ncbi:MAG TPA: hypothetical protein VHC90_14405 [Bryobacteraceae bacterium]|nr:hypothetical protein [Bryobacteraceae bacterium]